MGCDIHIEIEYRNKAGVWQPVYIEPQARWLIEQRDYRAFARLAGVRNYGNVTPIAAGRGLPGDIHPTTKSKLSNADHSFSWVLYGDWGKHEELQQLADNLWALRVWFMTEPGIGEDIDNPYEYSNWRIVFGFDN